MGRARYAMIVVLCVALAAGACTSDGTVDTAETVPSPREDMTRSAAGGAQEIARQIEAAGIGVVMSVADPMPSTIVSVTRHQVDRMAEEVANGSGIPGIELDEVTPLPADVPSLSFWLAAWLHDKPTPRAELVAGWYPDDTEWRRAQELLFSRAAILLFVADVAEDIDANAPPLDPDMAFLQLEPSPESTGSGSDPGSGLLVLATAPQAAPLAQVGVVCDAITTFFANRITALFDALRVSPGFLGEGPLGFIGGILSTLWNTVINIASATAVGLVRNLTAPVVEAIAGAVAVAGIVSHISMFITGWNIDVTADPAVTAFAVGAAPDNLGRFEVGPATGYRPWQPDLEQCARATGVELPRLLEPGSPVEWTITEGDPDIVGAFPPASPLIIELSRDERIPASERPTLRYRTNREDSDEGPPGFAFVAASARAPRAELQHVLNLARDLVKRTLERIVTSAVPVPQLAELARRELHELLNPVLDQLEAALRGSAEGSVLEVRGTGAVQVFFHGPPPEPTEPPADPDDPASRTCPYATTDQAISLSGVPGLRLGEVILPGDVREGMTVPWTSCAWTDDETWFVSVVVHRGPHVPDMAAGWREEMEDQWSSGSLRVQDVSGPWDHGFTLVARDPAVPWIQSSLYVGSGDVALEAHILGEPGPDATALAVHVWRRL